MGDFDDLFRTLFIVLFGGGLVAGAVISGLIFLVLR